MTDLTLVSTSTGKQLGAIRLVNGKAVCEGLAEQIFRSRKRNAHEPMSDKQVYEWFAAGWSNGPLAIVPGSTGKGAVSRARGGGSLKDYWLHGEGAGKWSTWTELYGHLRKHMVDELAKRTAAEWYHARYGIWPGSDKNRVLHGKPPRGQVVEPG